MNFNSDISFVMAERLRQLREEKNLSHEKLSRELNERYGIKISSDSLMNYERSTERVPGKHANLGMRVEYLRCLADFYGVSADYLLGTSSVLSPDPNTTTVMQHTGLSENNIDFLNLCVLVERYCAMHSPEKTTISSDPSFLEWAKASGFLEKSREEMAALPKLLDNFQDSEATEVGEHFRSISDLNVIRGLCTGYLLFVNNMIEIAKYNVGMMVDFMSLSPTARLGKAFLISKNGAQDTTDKIANTNSPWETIQCGMEQISYTDYLRFKAHEVSKAIEQYLLEKYSYGTHREDPK